MTHHYLSPAFGQRTDEDLAFLTRIDETTGFSLFWLDIVRPLLDLNQACHLLEIGADQGTHTQILIKYCNACDGTLTVIDPVMSSELQKVIAQSTRVRLIKEMSAVAIPKINYVVDSVLLEGDLNYHTVYGDLFQIEDLCKRHNTSFPIVFVKNTSWPYARRDMYYASETIPAAARHSYACNGMTPWSSSLQQSGLNAPFANAESEGGVKNGVLTAVEDFINISSYSLSLFSIPLFYGLGIIYPKNSPTEDYIRQNLSAPPALALFLETSEIARINSFINRIQVQNIANNSRKLLAKVFRRFGQFIIKRIEK